MIHKKVKVLLGTLALSSMVYAQQPPQGTPGPGAFWRQGGNTGPFGAPNIFGTATGNNNPIYTQTNGVQRMRLNGTLNYSVNAYPAQSKDGYLLLGQTSQASSQIFNNNNFGAFSMLHLNGSDNGTGVLQQGGVFTPEWIENRKRNQKERHPVWIVRLKVF